MRPLWQTGAAGDTAQLLAGEGRAFVLVVEDDDDLRMALTHGLEAEGFTVESVGADKVVRRLADNGVCALADLPNRALARMGAPDFGGAVTVGLAPYSTPYEVDHLVRTLGSLA